MLQQILKDMYIDPDVLEALNEDQKKTLFLKMRQEQVRRWQEREDKLERDGGDVKRTKPKKANSKNVSWLLGRDGDVAVIVIGEVDELSSRFICSGLEKRSPPSLQNNTHNQSILVNRRMVEPNRTEKDSTPSVTSFLLNKDTSTLPPLSVSVREHSSPPAAEKSEVKPVVIEPEEKSIPNTYRPLARSNCIIMRPASTAVTPSSLLNRSKPCSPTNTVAPEPAKTSKSQENHKTQELCKDLAASRVTVRAASEDPLSSGNGAPPCAGRGRVAQLMKAFSTDSSAGPPQAPGQTLTRGTKPPLPTKPSHLRAAATPSVR